MKYYRPETLTDLKSVLEDLRAGSTNFLAGGTDLLPRWEEGQSRPENLVDLKKIGEFNGIWESGSGVTIGALTSIQEIYNSPLIQSRCKALSEAARQFAGVQIRHRATIGGNICNASPAGDLLPGLYAHQAEVNLLGPRGKRKLPISELIIGPGKTALEDKEVLTAINLPLNGGRSLFYKLGLRQAMAIAVVNFALAYRLDSEGLFQALTIAAGSVAPKIVYLNQFSKAVMRGTSIKEAIDLVDDDISPIDDIRATGVYRAKALKNVLEYMLRYELEE